MAQSLYSKKPEWLKIRLPEGESYQKVKQIVKQNNLHTICSSGKCPNLAECWGMSTATFMILGDICTRSCRFCATKTGRPLAVDINEPIRVSESVKLMQLKHVVLTSVDRDDLSDGGANIWAATIREIRKKNPVTTIEALIPDFNGHWENLQMVIAERPEIISHNIETIKRITPQIRSKADYNKSLDVLRRISENGIKAKSGIMVGLGEKEEEVFALMDDLRGANCSILTIGQYLQPTKEHYPVQEYIHPNQFLKYRDSGLGKGFIHVESQPLVRSSYHAEKHV
ncbi:MAG: lipoyl synthase [Bacteroidales bacterium]|nr:lipoyl synthase [Bacteroidales bacterium]MDD4603478.1 lipoyl synthase [Bacteroidales bacterium]